MNLTCWPHLVLVQPLVPNLLRWPHPILVKLRGICRQIAQPHVLELWPRAILIAKVLCVVLTRICRTVVGVLRLIHRITGSGIGSHPGYVGERLILQRVEISNAVTLVSLVRVLIYIR